MKRLLILAVLSVFSSAALAFDPTPPPGNRIGILRTDAAKDDVVTLRVASLLRGYLARELRKQGFEPFHATTTYDDLLRTDEQGDADFYVEFVRGWDGEDPYGAVGIGGRHGGLELGMIVSRIAAAIRLYDGQTLQLIEEIEISGRERAVGPTAIGIGGRHLGVWVGGSALRGVRHRAAAREAAREAAASIAGILESEAQR